MRFTRSLGLLALGLAGKALADTRDSACATSAITTTTTTTETIFKEATTIYWSTVYVEPSVCATTTITVDAISGSSTSEPTPSVTVDDIGISATTSAVDGIETPATTSTVTVVGANEASQTASGVSATITSVVVAPAASDGPAEDLSTLGTNDEVFTWTGDLPTVTSSLPAPTYTNSPTNDSLSTPGSPSSNVTAPQTGNQGSSCNSPVDRSKWCDARSISTDYYAAEYSTGRTCSYELTISNTTLDFDGSGPKMAFAINGQVPGPLIECNWGDILQVTVHNELQNNATSIHWHGKKLSGRSPGTQLTWLRRHHPKGNQRSGRRSGRYRVRYCSWIFAHLHHEAQSIRNGMVPFSHNDPIRRRHPWPYDCPRPCHSQLRRRHGHCHDR